MGFICGIKFKFSRESAENRVPYILTLAAVWNLGIGLKKDMRISQCSIDAWT